MRKLFILSLLTLVSLVTFADVAKSREEITDTIKLSEVSVNGLYRNNINVGSLLDRSTLTKTNYGQEPSFVLAKMPSIYAYNDNGTNFGYSYFRLRGMGQERMNVTIDGMPWNEAEDFGCYFSNSPDLMASMHTIKVERGASVTTNGTSAYAGNITLESVDLRTDTVSSFDIGYGNFNTFRVSGTYNMGIKGHWGLHIRGTHQATDGYKTHAYNRSEAVTLKLGYYFNDNHNIEFLSMNGFHRNGQAFYGMTWDAIENPKPFGQIENGNLPQETDNFLMLVNKIQYNGKLSNRWYLTSSVYWNHLKGDYRINVGELYNYDLVQHLFGGNVIAKYVAPKYNITFGTNAYYFTRKHIGTPFATDSIVDIWHHKDYMTDAYVNRGNKPDINAFARGTWNVSDKFDVNASVQYRHTSLTYNVTKPFDTFDNDAYVNWNFVNGGIGATYKPTDNQKIYFRWATTGKEPSRVDILGAEYKTCETLGGETNVDPKAKERVNDFELGYEINTKSIKANVNAFCMLFNNELVASGVLSPQNGLPLHVQKNGKRFGLEGSVDYNPVSTLHFVENFGWSRNRMDGGKTHTLSPSLTSYTEVNYAVGSTRFGTSLNYRSRMYLDIENEYTLRPMLSWNAFVSTKITDNLELSGNFVNITNRLNTSSGSVSDGVAYYMVDTPFSFYINVKVSF